MNDLKWAVLFVASLGMLNACGGGDADKLKEAQAEQVLSDFEADMAAWADAPMDTSELDEATYSVLDRQWLLLVDSNITREEFKEYGYYWGWLNQRHANEIMNARARLSGWNDTAELHPILLKAQTEATVWVIVETQDRIKPQIYGERFYPGIFSGELVVYNREKRTRSEGIYIEVYSSLDVEYTDYGGGENDGLKALYQDFEQNFWQTVEDSLLHYYPQLAPNATFAQP